MQRCGGIKFYIMEKIKLNVKDESVAVFMAERLIGYEKPSQHQMDRQDISPHYLMQDKMYFKITNEFSVGDKFAIHLFDEGKHSRTELTNEYIYEVKAYDDISYEIKLIDFKVKLKDKSA